MVSSALLVSVVEACLQTGNQVALDFLMVLRVIRIFKIFHSVKRFRLVINAILRILPSMATYSGILMVFFYSFSMIGMMLFAGKLEPKGQNCGNGLLEGSQFALDNYCKNNFNDLFSSLVTLFLLLTVNQWHVITEGYVLLTNKGTFIIHADRVFHSISTIFLASTFSVTTL